MSPPAPPSDSSDPAQPPSTPATPPPPVAPGGHVSLEGIHGTVTVPPHHAGFWCQWRAFVGPAILVSVGYMDPGNWGTDLAAGAQFKYGLLWVVALASFMAVILQVISARLGIATGKDLAQCCRDWYPGWTRWPNWVAMELAIGATDLAELLGSAVALNLLFHIPLQWGILITALDVLLLLALQGLGMRMLEAVVTVFVATIGVCYGIEIFVLPQTQPSFVEMGQALLQPGFRESGMLVIAIGIIGATVMPHNLFLHSALVQSRKLQRDAPSIRSAIRFNTIDSAVALAIAFLINAGILVLAAMVFHGKESVMLPDGELVQFSPDSDWIRIAHLTLAPLLGTTLASTLFAVALLASGQSSTITGTLAGQVVMEGFMRWHLRPWIRRMISRLLAIIPAVWIVNIRGTNSVTDLINLSQVVLGLILPLALLPLMFFTSSRRRMGRWVNGWFLLLLGWGSVLLITAIGLYSLPESLKTAWRIIMGG
ncbi:MAG TPA: Nramp family divalent metal transporter [Verrucomicrobiota bacterium]|nr:Nramp family divalent metal transporter [Verrucomicrobiota bacterium]HQL77793.1 Nramp family divalent metal transporter [Verrucomicrobiota bacterium]